MDNPQDNWDELQSQWQAYEPDIKKLKKKINWVTWRMRFILLIDVLAVIGYFPFVYYIAQDPESTWVVNSWHYFMGLFLIYGVYLDFKIRLPILRGEGESTKEVLGLYLNRTKAGVLIGRWGIIFSVAIYIGFIIWVIANAFLVGGNPKVLELKFLLWVTAWIGGIGFLCHWYKSKKQKELATLIELWQEYL